VSLFQNPGETNFEELVACNRFINDIQLEIESALKSLNLSQSDLARMLDVSPARVSQILGGNGANLTARTVARIAYVLGLRACVTLTEECDAAWGYEDVAPEQGASLADYASADAFPMPFYEAQVSNDFSMTVSRARSAA
jgi:transcriptional regulator with XRE-family HTH domain